jgi:hypothetical protein
MLRIITAIIIRNEIANVPDIFGSKALRLVGSTIVYI